jgi:hypothetical protein
MTHPETRPDNQSGVACIPVRRNDPARASFDLESSRFAVRLDHSAIVRNSLPSDSERIDGHDPRAQSYFVGTSPVESRETDQCNDIGALTWRPANQRARPGPVCGCRSRARPVTDRHATGPCRGLGLAKPILNRSPREPSYGACRPARICVTVSSTRTSYRARFS